MLDLTETFLPVRLSLNSSIFYVLHEKDILVTLLHFEFL